jgi:hypothetical protein
MPTFAGNQSNHTPSTSADNWTMDASTAGDIGRVISIGWGGNLTTSTGYETRWVRPTTAGVGALTAITAEDHDPAYSTPLCEFGAGFMTTEPVLPAEPIGLHVQYWNAHGGLGYVALPLASPWLVVSGLLNDQLSCRNLAGTDAGGSSYSVVWNE